MSQQKVVLFDIDYTIFDTDIYREKFYPLLAEKLGYSLDEFLPLLKEASKHSKETLGHFEPSFYLKYLWEHKKTSISLTEFEESFWREDLYTESLINGAKEIFEELAGQDIVIGILSKGDDRHQRQKIAQLVSSLRDEHIHIFSDKIANLSSVLKKYEDWRVYIIDDLPEVLEAAKKLRDTITVIWVNRPKKFESSDIIDGFSPDYTISDITEVSDIVQGD